MNRPSESHSDLAANFFRTTQAEDKLRRENVRSKDRANQIHKEVGRKVRQTIRELGGTMPENLPTAESIRMVESREKKQLKGGAGGRIARPAASRVIASRRFFQRLRLRCLACRRGVPF